MKKDLEEIKALFTTLRQSIDYCLENGERTAHLAILAQIIEERIFMLQY